MAIKVTLNHYKFNNGKKVDIDLVLHIPQTIRFAINTSLREMLRYKSYMLTYFSFSVIYFHFL